MGGGDDINSVLVAVQVTTFALNSSHSLLPSNLFSFFLIYFFCLFFIIFLGVTPATYESSPARG